ncbi:hypothetical protein [Burkholderia ubonensis]|uniref:hypothetical protein n=1 Tax=Burkholderia ubonensis TaxID=101571 RepID=UPI000B059AC5|nr:hypothetical protein [Burkholderia ubonensis]
MRLEATRDRGNAQAVEKLEGIASINRQRWRADFFIFQSFTVVNAKAMNGGCTMER